MLVEDISMQLFFSKHSKISLYGRVQMVHEFAVLGL